MAGLLGRLFGAGNNQAQSCQPACQPAQANQFSSCSTAQCGSAASYSQGIVAGVAPVDLRQGTTYGGNHNNIVGIVSSTPSASASTPTTTSSASTSKSPSDRPSPKDTDEFLLMNGVNVRVDESGRISATINLTATEANGSGIKHEFKGTTPNGTFHQADFRVAVGGQSANVNYDNGKVRLWESKSGEQNLYHVSAANNVDTIIISIPGRGTPITLSRDKILKAKAESETKTAATGPTPSTAPATTTSEAKESPETAPSTAPEATISTTTETAKAQDIAGAAKELERLTTARSGLYNSPAVKEYKAQLSALLEKHPTLKERGDLVKAMGSEKLGLNLHEVAEFGEKVFDQIASPLTSNQLSDLKAAVVNLSAEYDKSSWWRKPTLIENAFKNIQKLGQDAKPLVETYWSLVRNNETCIGNEIMAPPTFDAAKKNLTGQTEAAPATSPTLSLPKSAEVEKVLEEATRTSADLNKVKLEAAKLKTDFQLRDTRNGRVVSYDLNNLRGALDILGEKSPSEKVGLLETAVGVDELTSRLKRITNKEQRESAVNGILGTDLMKKLDTFNSELSFGPLPSDKAALRAIDALTADEKKLLSIGWETKYKGQALFGRKSLGFQEQLDSELGDYKVQAK